MTAAMLTTADDLLVLTADGELTDSADALASGDTASVREHFIEHGYLYLRSFLPNADVGSLRALLSSVLQTHGWATDNMAAPASVDIRADNSFWSAHTELQRVEALHRLAHHDGLVALATLLAAETRIVVHPRKMVRIGYPHALAPLDTTPAHQDFAYTQGGADGLTMWLPLTSTPRRSGGLTILDGSSRSGARAVRVDGDDYACVPADLGHEPVASRRWLSADFEPGDVLVFHAFTVHAALPNRTGAVRLSVDYRYRGVSQPIGVTETWPPFHPFLPSWEDLSADWSSTRWIELLPGTRVKGARPPQRGLRVPASTLAKTAESSVPATEDHRRHDWHRRLQARTL